MKAPPISSEFDNIQHPTTASPALKIEQLINRAADIDQRFGLKLLHDALLKAHQSNANCIYLEPEELFIRIRYRIFGVLHEERHDNPGLSFNVRQALKTLHHGTDREPSEVHRTLLINKTRYSTHALLLDSEPEASLTINLIKLSPCALTLDQLTIPRSILTPLRHSIDFYSGLFLVSGPSGSKKKQTLLAILQELNLPEKKLISIEKLISQKLPRISHVSAPNQSTNIFCDQIINQAADVISLDKLQNTDFTNAIVNTCTLSSSVYYSVDANCVISAVLKLINQGISPTLLSRSLKGVLLQQPLNDICEHCKVATKTTAKQDNWIKHNFPTTPLAESGCFEGEGCDSCHQTGYSGVSIVYELILINAEMSQAIANVDFEALTTAIILRSDFQTLKSRAYNLARQGKISLDQAMQVQ